MADQIEIAELLKQCGLDISVSEVSIDTLAMLIGAIAGASIQMLRNQANGFDVVAEQQEGKAADPQCQIASFHEGMAAGFRSAAFALRNGIEFTYSGYQIEKLTEALEQARGALPKQ